MKNTKRKPVSKTEQKLLETAIENYNIAIKALKKANSCVNNKHIKWVQSRTAEDMKWNVSQAKSVLKTGWVI